MKTIVKIIAFVIWTYGVWQVGYLTATLDAQTVLERAKICVWEDL